MSAVYLCIQYTVSTLTVWAPNSVYQTRSPMKRTRTISRTFFFFSSFTCGWEPGFYSFSLSGIMFNYANTTKKWARWLWLSIKAGLADIKDWSMIWLWMCWGTWSKQYQVDSGVWSKPNDLLGSIELQWALGSPQSPLMPNLSYPWKPGHKLRVHSLLKGPAHHHSGAWIIGKQGRLESAPEQGRRLMAELAESGDQAKGQQ